MRSVLFGISELAVRFNCPDWTVRVDLGFKKQSDKSEVSAEESKVINPSNQVASDKSETHTKREASAIPKSVDLDGAAVAKAVEADAGRMPGVDFLVGLAGANPPRRKNSVPELARPAAFGVKKDDGSDA